MAQYKNQINFEYVLTFGEIFEQKEVTFGTGTTKIKTVAIFEATGPEEENHIIAINFWGDKSERLEKLNPGDIVTVKGNVYSRVVEGQNGTFVSTELDAWFISAKEQSGKYQPERGSGSPTNTGQNQSRQKDTQKPSTERPKSKYAK